MQQSPVVCPSISIVWLSFRNMQKKKLRDMTDIDFRRFASLLFALQLKGVAKNPIKEAVRLANELLHELQRQEQLT